MRKTSILGLGLALTLSIAGSIRPTGRPDADRPLKKDLKDGQAYVWSLRPSGWAVKTRSAILIFDYRGDAPAPDRRFLANGDIDPAELREFPVYVFISHRKAGPHDRQILAWKRTVPGIRFIRGFEDGAGTGAVCVAPRAQRTLGPLTITTIRSGDSGVGFAVQVDGLTLLHTGDQADDSPDAAPADLYPEIDFLVSRGIRADVGFFPNLLGCAPAHAEASRQGTVYAVEKLSIRTIFPMPGADRQRVGADLREAVARRGLKTEILFAANPGDRFFIAGAHVPLLGPCSP